MEMAAADPDDLGPIVRLLTSSPVDVDAEAMDLRMDAPDYSSLTL